MARRNKTAAAKKKQSNGAVLGFEETLWRAADKLRNNMDAAEYKHVVLGLVFLEYISNAFQDHIAALRQRIGVAVRQNRRLAALRDTLLPKLLSGEIKLPAAEAMTTEVTA